MEALWVWPSVLVFLWLLLGEPWMAERRKQRTQERIRRFHRDVDLAIIAGMYGRCGLERVLINDLKQLVAKRALDEGRPTREILELMR